MKISEEAGLKIKSILQSNSGKFPRIVLKKGGCAGSMLILVLEEPKDSDELVEVNDIKFAISEDSLKFINDVSIELKCGLGAEIIIKNNNATTCKCGKSFKI